MRDFKNMKRQRNRNRGPQGSGGKPNPHNINRSVESNGPEGIKVRGNAQSVYEKYQQLARDSFSAGDRVLAENYLQHAEHYFRVLRALQPNRPVADIVGRDVFTNGYDIDFEDEALDEPPAAAEPETVADGSGELDVREQRPGEFRQRDEARRDRDDFRRDDRGDRPRDERQGEFRRDRDRNRNRDDRYGDRPRDGERFERERDRDRRDGDRAQGYGERREGERVDRDRPRDGDRFERDRDRPREDRRDRFERDRERDRPERAAAEVISPMSSEATAPADPDEVAAATVTYAAAVAEPTGDDTATLRSENGDFSPAPAFLQGGASAAVENEDPEPRRPRPRRRRARAAEGEAAGEAERAPATEDA